MKPYAINHKVQLSSNHTINIYDVAGTQCVTTSSTLFSLIYSWFTLYACLGNGWGHYLEIVEAAAGWDTELQATGRMPLWEHCHRTSDGLEHKLIQ